MDFRVTLSPLALRELAEIVRFVALDNTDDARKLGETLLEDALRLDRFPFRHPAIEKKSLYRRKPSSRYLIYYHVSEPKRLVTIVHFWHSARQPPIP